MKHKNFLKEHVWVNPRHIIYQSTRMYITKKMLEKMYNEMKEKDKKSPHISEKIIS